MQRTDFQFELPSELIAQYPTENRTASRLLTLDGNSGELSDRQFSDFPGLLQPNDLLVFNNTKVIPARLLGEKETGGKIEVLVETTSASILEARLLVFFFRRAHAGFDADLLKCQSKVLGKTLSMLLRT